MINPARQKLPGRIIVFGRTVTISAVDLKNMSGRVKIAFAKRNRGVCILYEIYSCDRRRYGG